MNRLSCLVLITLMAGVGCARTPSYQFPVHKETKYFDFHYESNSPSMEERARFADAFIAVVNRDFVKADYDYPIQVFVLTNESRLDDFVNRELHIPGSAGFGMYIYSKRLLATYESSGLGTFTHETMHALVEKNLPRSPSWADEGIPTFFEKFYGYWKDNELILFWGFQNPWRIEELGNNLATLNLNEIVSDVRPEPNESKLRMVSLFLWKQGKFKRFLRLIASNDKRGYPSFFEGAMEMPLERTTPLWISYLNDIEEHRPAILSLPLSSVFDNEADFQRFAKLNNLSTEQVKQDD